MSSLCRPYYLTKLVYICHNNWWPHYEWSYYAQVTSILPLPKVLFILYGNSKITYIMYMCWLMKGIWVITLPSVKVHPDNKVHVANMGPTWVLSARDGSHVSPMNLAIRVLMALVHYGLIHVIHVVWWSCVARIATTNIDGSYLCIYQTFHKRSTWSTWFCCDLFLCVYIPSNL